MIQAFSAFAKQLLISGGFKVTEFPAKAYRDLLTGFEGAKEEQLVILPGMIKLAKAHPGYLVVDDTKNPKYGLTRLAKKLKMARPGQATRCFCFYGWCRGWGGFRWASRLAIKGRIHLRN